MIIIINKKIKAYFGLSDETSLTVTFDRLIRFILSDWGLSINPHKSRKIHTHTHTPHNIIKH